MPKKTPKEVEEWLEDEDNDEGDDDEMDEEKEVKPKRNNPKKGKAKRKAKPPQDIDKDIEEELSGLIDDDMDLTEMDEDEKTKGKGKTRLDKDKDEVLSKIQRKVMETVGDRFVKGIIAKIDMGIATITPDEPLSDSEKNSLESDLNMIMSSPELLEKITNLPVWVGGAMLAVSLSFIIIDRVMSYMDEKNEPKKDKTPTYDEADTPPRQPPKPKKKKPKKGKK